MKPGSNPFDPYGLMSAGPLAFWQMGFKLLATWQQMWLPGLGQSRLPLFSFDALVPRRDGEVPGTARHDSGEARALSLRMQLPGLAGVAPTERLAIEALIARQQGRDSPWLGCLQGVAVVEPPPAPAAAQVAQASDAGVPTLVATAAAAKSVAVKRSKAAAVTKRATAMPAKAPAPRRRKPSGGTA